MTHPLDKDAVEKARMTVTTACRPCADCLSKAISAYLDAMVEGGKAREAMVSYPSIESWRIPKDCLILILKTGAE